MKSYKIFIIIIICLGGKDYILTDRSFKKALIHILNNLSTFCFTWNIIKEINRLVFILSYQLVVIFFKVRTFVSNFIFLMNVRTLKLTVLGIIH